MSKKRTCKCVPNAIFPPFWVRWSLLLQSGCLSGSAESQGMPFFGADEERGGGGDAYSSDSEEAPKANAKTTSRRAGKSSRPLLMQHHLHQSATTLLPTHTPEICQLRVTRAPGDLSLVRGRQRLLAINPLHED